MPGSFEDRFKGIIQTPNTIIQHLKDDGAIPNNPILPLLVYQAALQLPEGKSAEAIEAIFAANQWGHSWRNGIYSFHHYHSTAHEVLACYSGTVKVQLGGEQGVTLAVQRGDVVIIPAGVGHKNLESSRDFRVVGAYPPDQTWDMNYGQPGERPQADKNIARVPPPPTDPIYGDAGPLVDHWLKKMK
jgi:uncharacterized protein YjlB